MRMRIVSTVMMAVLGTGAMADAYRAPVIDQAEDAGYLKQMDGEEVLFWPADAKVVGFRNMRSLVPTRRIEAAAEPLPLPLNLKELGSVPIELNSGPTTLDGYFDGG